MLEHWLHPPAQAGSAQKDGIFKNDRAARELERVLRADLDTWLVLAAEPFGAGGTDQPARHPRAADAR
jgi:hypothetical protein